MSKLPIILLLPPGIEKDMTNVPMSEEREQTVKCLLRRALPGDTGINAISPADGLTALQLAIKRSWDPFTKHLLHAGEPGICQMSSNILSLYCNLP